MTELPTQIDPISADFQANAAHNRALVDELRERLATVRRGGSERARQRHVERGKLLCARPH